MARRASQRPMRKGHKHDYTVGPNANIPRSMFDRSYTRKQSLSEAGYLFPCYADFMFPGDVFVSRGTYYIRLATPIHPTMDNLTATVHFWAVPCRILWDNWERFMGAQDNPADSVDYLIPQVSTVSGYTDDGLGDYLGLPVGIPGMATSALWHRAYNKIWNWGYRNQTIQNSVVENQDDGPDDVLDYTLLRKQKRGDYFTTALPYAQKGNPASLPLGAAAPVTGIGWVTATAGGEQALVRETGKAPATTTYANQVGGSQLYAEADPDEPNWPHIEADLANATGVTINELRQASVVQRILERDARSGTRITEKIYAAFRVTVPDYRAQQPEFIGGGSFGVNVSAVPQTTSTDATTPQGNLAGYGVGVGQAGFTYSAVEHMVVLGLISVHADVTYQQGIPKQFLWKTNLDFYTPDMQGLGEQVIENREIFAKGSGDPQGDLAAFGYQERFAELRTKNSEVCGLFRSGATGTLDAWHYSQEFGGVPTLNDAFIREEPPVGRTLAVLGEAHFILDSSVNLRCARPLGTYGTPGITRL